MASLTFKNITQRWGDVIGVDDFNLHVQDSEFIVVLGPSNCGKSTLMRIVAGLETPTKGELMIDDQVVNHLAPKDRDVAMVFQNYALYPHLTVYENIRFPLKVRKVPVETHDSKVRHAASLVELDSLLQRKPKELSNGQKQRVALARAIVREPKIFLMDEPLSNLDAKLRDSARAQLKNLRHKLKITTIYATHDQTEAMTLADRVVVMKEGCIQQIESPSKIYNEPANLFVAGFIGSLPMNLLDGVVKGGKFVASKVSINVKKNSPAGKVRLGFRPEDVSITENQRKTNVVAPICGVELLGDTTVVNVKIGDALVSIRTHKEYQAEIGTEVKIEIPSSACHFFDIESGWRLS